METLGSLKRRALFIGAHPDDIELGAGGTAARLVNSDWEVWFCILTSESNSKTSQKRKHEATAAAQVLGINPKRILFTDFPDANLVCTGETVGRVRQLLSEVGLDPDIVFTHTQADSHNDHRTTHEISKAAFRKKPILTYAVVNSLISSKFEPRIFTDVSSFYAQKLEALRLHHSQSNRVNESAIEKLSKSYSASLGFSQTEAFELMIQEGGDDKTDSVLGLNDCPFHNFWYVGSSRVDLQACKLEYSIVSPK